MQMNYVSLNITFSPNSIYSRKPFFVNIQSTGFPGSSDFGNYSIYPSVNIM